MYMYSQRAYPQYQEHVKRHHGMLEDLNMTNKTNKEPSLIDTLQPPKFLICKDLLLIRN